MYQDAPVAPVKRFHPSPVNRLADESSIILLFIPTGSDTKAGAMDDQRPGIINEQRS
jgi:hypothetical protein